jgi:quercetin dioxygenase-like cupin family protein
MAESTASHTRWNDIEIEHLSSLIGRQLIVGTNVMVARVLLKKGARVPLHSHHNEQVSYVLDGVLKFFLDNREVIVCAGEVCASRLTCRMRRLRWRTRLTSISLTLRARIGSTKG